MRNAIDEEEKEKANPNEMHSSLDSIPDYGSIMLNKTLASPDVIANQSCEPLCGERNEPTNGNGPRISAETDLKKMSPLQVEKQHKPPFFGLNSGNSDLQKLT